MNAKSDYIAVFDSGVGGISVLRHLINTMPGERYLYFGDSANAPYGSRTTEEIRKLTLKNAEMLFDRGSKALVVACNTATSAAINDLRALYPGKIIIGIEPALKLAVCRHPRGKILVMATDATLREQKFHALAQQVGRQCEIVKCPCPALVEFVERGELDSPALDGVLREELGGHLTPPPDAVVLGCTHYPFLRKAIRRCVGSSPEILDGSDGTAKETRRRLEGAGLLRHGAMGRVEVLNSLNDVQIIRLSKLLLAAPEEDI